jgi:hypothetical protein
MRSSVIGVVTASRRGQPELESSQSWPRRKSSSILFSGEIPDVFVTIQERSPGFPVALFLQQARSQAVVTDFQRPVTQTNINVDLAVDIDDRF